MSMCHTRFDLPGYNCASRKEKSHLGGLHGSMILVRSDISDILEIETGYALKGHEMIGIRIKGNNHRPEMKIPIRTLS